MTAAPVVGALLADGRRAPGRLLLTGLAIAVATVFAALLVAGPVLARGQGRALARRSPPWAAPPAGSTSPTPPTSRAAPPPPCPCWPSAWA